MLVLQTEKFMDTFLSLEEYSVKEDVLDNVLRIQNIPMEEWKEAKRIFHVLVRVMKAKAAAELDDISLDDILDCFVWQPVFESYFSLEKAGTYFQEVSSNIQKFHTVRKRRIL